MMFIDTHVHLYDEVFAEDRDLMIQKAIDAGVGKLYMPNCDSTTIEGMLAIEAAWKDRCFAMMGLHPVYVKENFEEELGIVSGWLERRKFSAIGEVGLDKYWDLTYLEQQKEAFRRQIDLAAQYDLAVIIHSREATQDCIDIIREKQSGNLRGIFHCFSGTIEEARQVTELGFHLGIGGVVTFKKSNLPEIIAETDLEYLVLETDAPYLAPVPYRGKRNESSYIPLIADKVAIVKQLPLEEVARVTTENAQKIFR